MTELRRRMIECLQLSGLSERPQDMDVRAVRPLAAHYRKSPDLISEEELRPDFRYVTHVKPYSRSASTLALCGIKFCLRADPPPRLDHLAFCASATRANAAGDPQSRSGSQAARLRATAALPRGPHHDLLLWSPASGGDPSEGARSRERSYADPRPSWYGRESSVCPLAAPNAGPASPVWGHAPSSSPDLPGTRPWWELSVDRYRPNAPEQWAGRVPGSPQSQRHPPTGVRAHAAAFLGDPCAGGWRQSPAHSSVSRAQLSHHHERLHAPDGQR